MAGATPWPGCCSSRRRSRERRLHIGYRRARLRVDCALGAAGNEIMGHEFHYARTLSIGDEPLVDCRDVVGRGRARRRARAAAR